MVVYLDSWNDGGPKKEVGVGNITPRAFPRTCRLLLAPSWLSSNRARKTAPGGVWYTPPVVFGSGMFGCDAARKGVQQYTVYRYSQHGTPNEKQESYSTAVASPGWLFLF